jgi:uncharacterized membrane protein YedE/YeeE
MIIGAAIFGVGWGISGQCPGSAVASLGAGNWTVIISLTGMFLGAYLRSRFIKTKIVGTAQSGWLAHGGTIN